MYESVHLALPRCQFVLLCNIDLASRLCLKETPELDIGSWKLE